MEAEKRVARGIAAALMQELEHKKSALNRSEMSQAWWPVEYEMEIELPRADQVALASWIGDPAWGVIVAPFFFLADVDKERAIAAKANHTYQVGKFIPTIRAIDIAIGALREEIDNVLAPNHTAPGEPTGAVYADVA